MSQYAFYSSKLFQIRSIFKHNLILYVRPFDHANIFNILFEKKKSLSHFKQILNISNDFRNIASFIKEKLVEILWICLKSSQIRTFPRMFCSRNMLYIENYLEYFRSVWSAKNYFFHIKCWKYSHGRKAADMESNCVWICF